MRWPHSIRFRYSLRALLVFLTVLALWGGYHTNRGIKERRALEVFRRHGGASISFSSFGRGRGLLSQVSDVYKDVVRFVWRDQFLTSVHLRSLSPEILDALDALPQLQEVGVGSQRNLSIAEQDLLYEKGILAGKVPLPDGAIRRLLSNHRLRSLALSAWILSDDDCRAISRHHSLEGLQIVACELSEEGFAEQMSLPRLRWLTFSYCNVAGSKLGSVAGLKSLEQVEAQCTPVGSDLAAWIARCPNVKFLHLRSDTIDDEFITTLGQHQSLAHVSFISTNVTDECIMPAISWPSLKDFTVHHVSNQAKAGLRKARPDVVVP